MKKAGPLSSSKNSSSSGKSSGILSKSGTKSGNILGSTSKFSSVPSSSMKSYSSSYSSTSFTIPKKGKSTSFGIIWIPTKRKNKHKDQAYNSQQKDRSRDRSPSMYNFMSGDSSNHTTFLEKKEDKSCLLVPEQKQNSSIGILGTGSVVTSEISPDVSINRDEKVELIKPNEEESKEAAGDTGDTPTKEMEKEDIQSNEKVLTQPPLCNKEKLEDNVDSVFLRSPPPHKARSAASTIEEESCGMKCLYYTLQCCDCVLM